jgi:integrase
MKGSITKYTITGSSRPHWRFRIYIGKDETGRKLYDAGAGTAGFLKEGDARTAMKKRMDELAAKAGAPSLPPKTVGDWLQEWLDTYAVDRCQPKTLERYNQLARYVLKTVTGEPSTLAQTSLSDLTHQQLESGLYALLKANGKRRKHISARTVRHVGGLLRVALNKAFKLELVPVNPMLRVELPSVEKKDARSLAPDEIRSLRDACRGDWTFMLVEVALASGARRGEMLALQWSDLNWASRKLTISKSLEQTEAGLRVKKPKNGKTRPCRLPPSAIVALQFQRDQQAEQRRQFAGDYKDNGLIFCQPDGNFHEPDLVSQVVIRRMRKVGIRGTSFHTLRHTHASILLSRGVPLPAVSARLGHADPSVTARIYSHALPADDQRAADVWENVISEQALPAVREGLGHASAADDQRAAEAWESVISKQVQ